MIETPEQRLARSIQESIALAHGREPWDSWSDFEITDWFERVMRDGRPFKPEAGEWYSTSLGDVRAIGPDDPKSPYSVWVVELAVASNSKMPQFARVALINFQEHLPGRTGDAEEPADEDHEPDWEGV